MRMEMFDMSDSNKYDNEMQKERFESTKKLLGARTIDNDFSADGKRKDLDSMAIGKFNSTSDTQPKETNSDEKKDYAQTVTAFRTPTKDTENPPLT